MICKGYTKVSVGSIWYNYEDRAIPEVLDYSHKDIAKECVAQLKVSLCPTTLIMGTLLNQMYSR